MTQTQEIEVPLDELAGELGGTREMAEHWVRQTKGKIHLDWRGRPVTSAASARAAFSAHNKHAGEDARLASEYDRYLRNRQAELIRIGEDTFQRVVLEHFNSESRALATATDTFYTSVPMTPSPMARHAAQKACNQARADHELKHPLMTFEQLRRKASKR